MILYIDPGTGSMLFTILIGVFSVGVFFIRSLILKLKFFLTAGKGNNNDKNRYPYVIFTDDKRYWNTFEPICQEFEKRKEKLIYITASEDDPALKTNFEYVTTEFAGKGNSAFSKMNLIKADVVLATTPNLDVYQWKRSRDVKHYTHILHCVGDITMYHMFSLDFYDSVLLSGPVFEKQIRDLEKLRNQPAKEITTVGLPYLDTMHERVKNTPRVKNEKPVILLAPSWGSNSILRCYGTDFIDALLETGYHIIVRPHPQTVKTERDVLDPLIERYSSNDQLEWNYDNDNFDVLNRSDLLVSDFSGIMYDYCLVFEKPIIFAEFEYDDSCYDAYWLDETPWLLTTLNKIGKPLKVDNVKDIKSLIDSSLNDPGRFEVYEQVRKEGWNHIGESAKLTVDFMINKRNELINNKK